MGLAFAEVHHYGEAFVVLLCDLSPSDLSSFHQPALLPLQVPSLAKAAAIARIALCSR